MRVVFSPGPMATETEENIRCLLPFYDHRQAPQPTLETTSPWNNDETIVAISDFLKNRIISWAAQGMIEKNTVLSIRVDSRRDDSPVIFVWPDIHEIWTSPDWKNASSPRVIEMRNNFMLGSDDLLIIKEPSDIQNFVWNGFKTALHARWKNLKFPEPSFDKWWGRMTEKHRWYHTPVHVYQMMAVADAWIRAIEDPIAVNMAVFFHDLVYETSLKDAPMNEENSASFLWAWMKETPEEWRTSGPDAPAPISAAAAMIKATQGHELSSWHRAHRFCIPDAKLFLDMDMSIMACKNGITHFERSTRKEWSNVNDDIYRVKRIKFLKGLLDRKTIFLSEHASLLESRARYNIRMAIATLERA